MSNKNYQIAKLYSRLFAIEQELTSDVLPLAVNVGLNDEDAKLYESLEIAAADIREHLTNFQLSIKETK